MSDPRRQARIEQIGRVFLEGYHAALENDQPGTLVPRLETVDSEARGFAYEGAAMGLAVLDQLTPWNRTRIHQFLQGPGDPHTYVVHVAVGWVAARLPLNLNRLRSKLDPLLGWLVLDGYGFHEGYFRWARYLGGKLPPARLAGYERRAFDQGLGRSFWFVEGADVKRIAGTIAGFDPDRRPDLWSGVGLAGGYAGGVEEPDLELLAHLAGPCRPQLAQGVAFAAKARQRAGNIAPNTEIACRILCETTVEKAAQLTDAALENLLPTEREPAYEIWRRRIQAHFARSREVQA